MGRTVRDVAILLGVIAGPDPDDGVTRTVADTPIPTTPDSSKPAAFAARRSASYASSTASATARWRSMKMRSGP